MLGAGVGGVRGGNWSRVRGRGYEKVGAGRGKKEDRKRLAEWLEVRMGMA
jgi:hypothetical protein